MSSFTFSTPDGLISITDTALKNDNPALCLIHGNSSSSKIFSHFFASPFLTSTYRLITFDLPGHGASSNAPEPEKSYTMRGYADLTISILKHLNITSVVVLGWSLGGHIGIEMLPLIYSLASDNGTESAHTNGGKIHMKGLMLVGTPPANGLEETNQGFLFQDGHMSNAAKRDLSDEEIKGFAQGVGEPFESWMEDDIRRTDGKSRFLMWKSFVEGRGVQQKNVVECEDYAKTMVAVVNGAEEPLVSLEYLDRINWANLWGGKCVRLEGLGHTPFWERPEAFEEILVRFLGDV